MPEILEVESYRQLADLAIGQRIERGWADAYCAKKLSSTSTWARAVKGLTIEGTDRRGKLLLLLTDGPTLGIRFGMTGVLLRDGDAGIEGLFYGPHEFKREWVRGGLSFVEGGELLLHDPRRLARFEINPDLDELGPDALSLTRQQLEAALGPVRQGGIAIKAKLLDQSAIAGIGNLLADEALFRAGIDPRRPCGQLNVTERTTLHKALRTTTRTLGRRGGSHTGDHMVARHPGAPCPYDGAPMRCATVGGRTTYWCSSHQH